MLKLQTLLQNYYIVKENDDLFSVCYALHISPTALCVKNNLARPADFYAGRVVYLPPRGNLYTVQAGDSMENLCGSKARYIEYNGNDVFYIGKRVRIP